MEKESLESLLHQLKMDDEIDAFRRESLDLEILKEMTESQLKETLIEMQLNAGKRWKLNKAITNIKSSK